MGDGDSRRHGDPLVMTGDEGVQLNAQLWVDVVPGGFEVVLASAGGKVKNSELPRNSDYVPALTLILARLREMGATLESAAVVSSEALKHLSESERALLDGPVRLADVSDIEGLRDRITRAQKDIGREAGATTDSNRRIGTSLGIGTRYFWIEPRSFDLVVPSTARGYALTLSPYGDSHGLTAR